MDPIGARDPRRSRLPSCSRSLSARAAATRNRARADRGINVGDVRPSHEHAIRRRGDARPRHPRRHPRPRRPRRSSIRFQFGDILKVQVNSLAAQDRAEADRGAGARL
jgi:hypothetical protein